LQRGTTRSAPLLSAWRETVAILVTVGRRPLPCAAAVILLCPFAAGAASGRSQPATPTTWWPAAVESVVAHAGTNRGELVAALNRVPVTQRPGLQFLIENMPDTDLRTLSSRFLLEQVALSYDALEKAPWKERIPPEIFLNDILPYACLNETRDASRVVLRRKALPLIADCRTPAEAAQRLNQKLFSLLNVRYSTERKRPDQSPLESIESGIATCSGLSILLVDACRAVGIPARVVGTPLWTNLRGNHTWVEIWDGQWHFTGAAEPDPQGLDHGWFKGDAAAARRDIPQHAIYASSFKRTGLAFPLVWAPEIQWIPAVNVTDRYTAKVPPVDPNKTRLLVKALGPNGKRVAASVTVTNAAGAVIFQGTSKDESADLNDMLAVEVARGGDYQITIKNAGRTARSEVKSGTNAEALVTVNLEAASPSPASRIVAPLPSKSVAQLKKALTEYFVAPAEKQASWAFAADLEALLRDNEPAVRAAAWEAYRAAPLHEAMQRDFAAKQVRFERHLSAYTVKTVGTRPATGWPLFIAMHGGGGAPKEVNDSQWQHMQVYYKDHPEAGGYVYVALRAPNDTWNGFYDDYVYPLVANLIRQFLLWGDVDANKVFLMGYSHGGYGAFAIGPKMPDRFAAIHASAAAPTDGETTPRTLRNTVFSTMVGDQDTMYGRIERVRRFDDEVRALRGQRTDIYPVKVEIKAGFGHGGLPDRDKIVEMYPAERNAVPRELTWLMTDAVITDFFWLHTNAPGKTQEINATCRDNRITVTTTPNVTSATVLLDTRLIDFGKPVTLEVNGKKSEQRLEPSLRTLCATLARRGDPELAFTAQLDLPLP